MHERLCWLRQGQQRREPNERRQVLELRRKSGQYGSDCREAERAKEVGMVGKASQGQKQRQVETGIGKKDGWKQERQIVNRVKSMPTDGGMKNNLTDGGEIEEFQ